MSKQISVKTVTEHVKDGSTLATVGFTLMGACGTILNELERSFLETGHPSQITLLHGAGQSNRVDGIQRLAHKGLLKRIIGSHWGLAPKLGELIHNNDVEAFCLPQGQLVHLFRAMASGKPGNFSKVGAGYVRRPAN
jgi:propionate CoA-transferase